MGNIQTVTWKYMYCTLCYEILLPTDLVQILWIPAILVLDNWCNHLKLALQSGRNLLFDHCILSTLLWIFIHGFFWSLFYSRLIHWTAFMHMKIWESRARLSFHASICSLLEIKSLLQTVNKTQTIPLVRQSLLWYWAVPLGQFPMGCAHSDGLKGQGPMVDRSFGPESLFKWCVKLTQ